MPRETKADREAREAREAEQAAAEKEPTQPEEAAPTIHIPVIRGEDGNITVDVLATGDVRVTEIESLLKLALKRWEEKAGLG